MKDLFGGIYKGKRVFITGHTGFKGSWMSYWFTRLGANVTGYSIDIPTRPSHFKLLKLDMNSITGDIRDLKKLTRAIKTTKPEIIFHLAAQPIVRKSFVIPLETLETNIMGTVNVLEASRHVSSIKAVEIITSDKCYRNTGIKGSYKETDPMGGNDPYSASKGCAELVVEAYRKSYFDVGSTLVASTRAGNVIGGGDWGEARLIPDLVREAAHGHKAEIRYPEAIRPWQHVLDPLSGYLALGAKLMNGEKKFAGAWNFGPGNKSGLKVREVAKIAKESWGEIDFKIQKNKPRWNEENFLTLDSSKARKYLKWRSVWNTRKIIKKTIDWYKGYYRSKNILTEADLEQYIRDAKKLALGWTG